MSIMACDNCDKHIDTDREELVECQDYNGEATGDYWCEDCVQDDYDQNVKAYYPI
jgi:hypothetical protein